MLQVTSSAGILVLAVSSPFVVSDMKRNFLLLSASLPVLGLQAAFKLRKMLAEIGTGCRCLVQDRRFGPAEKWSLSLRCDCIPMV